MVATGGNFGPLITGGLAGGLALGAVAASGSHAEVNGGSGLDNAAAALVGLGIAGLAADAVSRTATHGVGQYTDDYDEQKKKADRKGRMSNVKDAVDDYKRTSEYRECRGQGGGKKQCLVAAKQVHKQKKKLAKGRGGREHRAMGR